MSDEIWYRYRDVCYAPPVDEDGEAYGKGHLEIVLDKLQVEKRTPKGVWLYWYGMRRFVLREARKQFACPTIEEAHQSFLARKKRQARIYRARLRTAEQAILLMERTISHAPNRAAIDQSGELPVLPQALDL